MREATVRLIAIVGLTSMFAANLNGRDLSPAAGDDLVIGQWRLDVSKSKYSPGPGPKSETRTYRSTEDGIRAVIIRTHQDGQVQTIEYEANYDSVNHVVATPDYDALQLKRINAFVSEATLSHAGKQFGTARREISRDGMTMFITFQQGAQTRIHNVAYYMKVAP